MKRGIGLQLGENEFSVASIHKSEKSLVIDGLFSFTNNNEKELKIILSRLVETHKWNKYDILASIPVCDCIVRKLNVPFTQEEKINQVFYFETERYIHNHAIENLIIDYKILEKFSDKTKIMTIAAQKEHIRTSLDFLEETSVHPYEIDIDAMGIVQLFLSFESSTGNTFIIHVHRSHFDIILLYDGQIKDIRSVRCQIHTIADGLLSDLEDTVEISINENILTPSTIQQIQQKIIKEIKRTLIGTDTFDKFYITGRRDITQKLPELFRKELKTESELWDFRKNFTFDNEVNLENIDEFSVAIGLAIKACNKQEDGFHFRKEEFGYDRAFSIMKKPLSIMLSMFLLSIVLLSIYFVGKNIENKLQYKQLIEKAKISYKKVSPEKNLESIKYWNKIYHVYEVFKEQSIEKEELPKNRSALMVWSKFFQALKPVRTKFLFTIDRFEINKHELLVNGKINEDIALDSIKESLLQVFKKSDFRVLYLQRNTTNRNFKKTYKVVLTFEKKY